MMVKRCELAGAIEWISSRYYVPQVARKTVANRERWNPRCRVGVSGFCFEDVVRSGLWASLTPCERAVLAVLPTFAEPSTGRTEISYLGIMRFSGVRSPSTVSKVLKRFRQLHMIEIWRSTDAQGFRGCNSYRLTLDTPEFLRMAREIHRRTEQDIAEQRAQRAEQRGIRRRRAPVKVNPLYSECTA